MSSPIEEIIKSTRQGVSVVMTPAADVVRDLRGLEQNDPAAFARFVAAINGQDNEYEDELKRSYTEPGFRWLKEVAKTHMHL